MRTETHSSAPPTLDARSWYRCRRPQQDPRLRIICFPHAGGSASFFRSWPEHLPEGVELVAAQYPGRGDRLDEPAPAELRRLADHAAAALQPLLDRPYVLFGQSMGALVAYEVALRLEAAGLRTPVRLVVSSCAAPSGKHRSRGLGRAGDEELLRGLREIGGDDVRLPTDPELLSLILPVTRADMAMADRYLPLPATAVSAPVTAVAGDTDTGVDLSQASLWARHTTGGFGMQVFPGGHFYLVGQEERLIGNIMRLVTETDTGD
ncbi:thioesterase II family protein [Streptomyces sp. NPDC060027]|uniref:thioesterase II family protein n=1 Tax=Streptomyces sp. NPDC060027 TaxID=3347040 RepID=UPI0036A9634A